MDRPVEATHEEQHRRHFYRVFSSVLRIRSRDRARNDITALYELHLRNDGMPYEPAQVFLFWMVLRSEQEKSVWTATGWTPMTVLFIASSQRFHPFYFSKKKRQHDFRYFFQSIIRLLYNNIYIFLFVTQEKICLILKSSFPINIVLSSWLLNSSIQGNSYYTGVSSISVKQNPPLVHVFLASDI